MNTYIPDLPPGGCFRRGLASLRLVVRTLVLVFVTVGLLQSTAVLLQSLGGVLAGNRFICDRYLHSRFTKPDFGPLRTPEPRVQTKAGPLFPWQPQWQNRYGDTRTLA